MARNSCSWCSGHSMTERVKVREHPAAKAVTVDLCRRCIGSQSTLWRSRAAVEPEAVLRARAGLEPPGP